MRGAAEHLRPTTAARQPGEPAGLCSLCNPGGRKEQGSTSWLTVSRAACWRSAPASRCARAGSARIRTSATANPRQSQPVPAEERAPGDRFGDPGLQCDPERLPVRARSRSLTRLPSAGARRWLAQPPAARQPAAGGARCHRRAGVGFAMVAGAMARRRSVSRSWPRRARPTRCALRMAARGHVPGRLAADGR